jgi:hypothetical protein
MHYNIGWLMVFLVLALLCWLLSKYIIFRLRYNKYRVFLVATLLWLFLCMGYVVTIESKLRLVDAEFEARVIQHQADCIKNK